VILYTQDRMVHRDVEEEERGQSKSCKHILLILYTKEKGKRARAHTILLYSIINLRDLYHTSSTIQCTSIINRHVVRVLGKSLASHRIRIIDPYVYHPFKSSQHIAVFTTCDKLFLLLMTNWHIESSITS